jgi:hypothetical protein
MNKEQELKELLDRLKKWKENKGNDDEFDEIVNAFQVTFDPAGDDPGSNPPHGPGTPP